MMSEIYQIKDELNYIHNSITALSSNMNDINNSIMNINNGIEPLLILIVLICINSNIKKLTQAIRENKN